ncbi:hypothetical protein BDP27DRAFT_1365286 [Rhodocollybia butyracea]|uniref:Uncharacterized protein n=1 Tax=Rhodocollybia butyracea TaxID=206335 RepID=A0A9P5PPC5_9AGAR|nr:hypothetical protein BDP27DRAFT_1365286 [Rhodocollybia butyracea]
MSIVQYTVFPDSELPEDRSPFTEALIALTTAEGHIRCKFELLNISRERKFMNVDSLAHSPDYKSKKKARRTVTSSPVHERQHCSGEACRHRFTVLKGDPSVGLASENTEFVIITPKDGVSFDTLKETALRLRDVWDDNGHPSAISVEEGMILNIVGWSSTKHHYDTVKEEPYAAIVKEFSAIGVFDMSHANMEKAEKVLAK